MRAKRYEIQFSYLNDTVEPGETKWYSMRTGSSRRRSRAVKNWWARVSNNQELKLFRLVDTKTGKVIR